MSDVSRRSRDGGGRFANEHGEAGAVVLGTPGGSPEPTPWMRVQAAHLATLTNLDVNTIFAVAQDVPDSQPRTAGEAAALQKWCDVTGCQPGQLMFVSSQMQAAAGSGPDSPSAVLAMATGSTLDPANQKMPMWQGGTVEIVVDEDDAEDIFDRAGSEIDTNLYREIYADVDIYGKDEGDFYGVTRDGEEVLLGLGVYLGSRIDLEDGNLEFRGNNTDPRPAYREARKAWRERRQDASETLMSAMGVSVVQESTSEYMMTNEDGGRLRLKANYFDAGRLVETVNWRTAADKDIEAFLGGPATPEGVKTFTLAAAVTARAITD